MSALDPAADRAALRATIAADPAKTARYDRIESRLLRRPSYAHRAATRPTTTAQALADFNAWEAAEEAAATRRGGNR